MTEYITKEQALRRIKLNVELLSFQIDDIEDVILQTPPTDVVEVVRCEDCKHMRTISGEGWGIDTDLYYCAENEILVSPVGYCSDGKRKTGGYNE